MKTAFFWLIVVVVLSCTNNHSENSFVTRSIPMEGLFVGYKNGKPVFHSEKDSLLILLEKNKFYLLSSIPSNSRIQSVSDNGIILSNNSNTISIQGWDGSIRTIELEDKIDYLTTNKNFDTIFYQNQSSTNVSLYIPEKRIYKKDIFNGEFPIYSNGKVYFMEEINPSGEGGYNGAVLKYYDSKNQSINNVSKQKNFIYFSISNDGNYILTSMEIDKNIKQVVYNLKTGKIQTVDVPDGLGMSFFSYNSDSAFYYSVDNINEIKGYKIY